MRKLQFFLLIIVAGFLLAVWSPWNHWNFSITQIFGIEPPAESSGLVVTSLAGELEVYVDNDYKGIATANPPQNYLQPGISPGEHQVRLVRISDTNNAYVEFNRLVNFVSGVDIVISYELGPTEEFSEGHIISVTRNADFSKDTYINISSEPSSARVTINGVTAGETPVVLYPIDLNSQLQVTLEKDGYEPQAFTILPETQESRDKLQGYTLDIDSRLFLMPIRIVNE